MYTSDVLDEQYVQWFDLNLYKVDIYQNMLYSEKHMQVLYTNSKYDSCV